MAAVYLLSQTKSAILVSPSDVLKNSTAKDMSKEQLDKIINDLSLDGYFDLVYSDRRGEQIYCITLTSKGKAFGRTNKIMRRNLIFRITLTAILAVFSFVIGLILKAIFN